ncbi:hypothetical protein FBALC1_01512 [Flavobacteriales bacterium ALC-1]|nr:hypothetical protein FBALC1_01512 [Flavobacteriales bacterium ALC-1]
MKNSINKIIFLPLIYIGLLSAFDFFFKDYKDQSKYEISKSTYIIIFSIALLLIFLFVSRYSQETDKFIKYAKSFAYAVFFGFIVIIYLETVKDQTAFHFNKLYAKNIIAEDFEITQRAVIDEDSIVGLRSVNNKYKFYTENKFSLENLIYIQKNDTIKIKYSVGLLNKPFLQSGKIEIVK